MRILRAYLRLARLENAVLPSFAMIAGFTFAYADDYRKLVIAILALILAHTVVTIWNDIADEAGDKRNNITRIADIRKFGLYNKIKLLVGISVFAIFVTLLFLPTAARLLALFSLLIGWAYNNRPIQASHRPLLSIALLGLVYGLVPFLWGASLGHLTPRVIIMAIGWAIGRSSLSLLKDYKDAKGDALSDKRTFLLVYGGTLTAKLSFCLAAAGFLICITTSMNSFHQHMLTAVVILTGSAMWLLYLRSELFKTKQYRDLNQIFHECVRYQLIFDGLMIICLRTL